MTTHATTSIEELLHKLISDSELPPEGELAALSDLTLAEVARVRSLWGAIPEARRFHTVDHLVMESIDNLHLELGRLLRIALEDESGRVRARAVEGLWEDVGEDLVGPFIQLLLNDPEEEVRAAAAAALGTFVLAGELDELDSSLAIRTEEALLSVLHSETELLSVQSAALESIAFSGEVGVRQLIEDGYYSPYEEMRLSSMRAMARSADTRWRAAVRAELDSPEAAMRAEAARACGELEARAALPELLELLSDEEKAVRLAAIFALGRLGGQEAEDALGAMSLSDDEEEADAAAVALEEAVFYGDSDIPLYDDSASDWADDLDDLDEW